MNTLVQILTELTGHLRLAGGVTEDMLAEVRRKVAAVLILGSPGLVPVPADPSADPLLQQAAKAGELLAAQWKVDGTRVRYVEEPYLALETDPEQPTAVIGPFVTKDLTLVQYSFYQAAKFLTVRINAANIALLPLTTAKDPADPTKWNIQPGSRSVWIAANRLVTSASGWAGLRVTGGTLVAPSAAVSGNVVQLDPNKPWSLTITPEPAPPTAAGSDGDAAVVTLPTQLRVSAAAPVVTGLLGLTGFGTPLSFTTPAGSAVKPMADNVIVFPYATGNAKWQISSNRVRLSALTLPPTEVSSPGWTLRTTPRGLPQLGEVRHGGSLAFRLPEGIRSQVLGTVRESRWRLIAITANARGIDMQATKALCDITMDLALWGQSRTTAKISVRDPASEINVRHASRRGGPDVVTFSKGRVVNNWDRPRAASGTPVEFEGQIDNLSLIAEPTNPSRRRVVIQASRVPVEGTPTQGYALENLYLHTGAAGRMSLVGSGTPTRLNEGHARLLFDVRLAQPMLPNPYAANWDAQENDFTTAASALAAVVRWPSVNAPTMESTLVAKVRLPDPPSVDDPERTNLYLLDVSGRDDQLGIAIWPFDHQPPSIEQNRLVWPMSTMALTMLPQVLWEPVQIIEQPLP
jgi:hypothetical protein